MHEVKNGSEERRKWLGVAALAIGCLAAAAVPTAAQERGRCASVNLEWPIRLPDGSVHRARTLSLCLNDYWTPVSGLHELKLDGQAIGRFMSHVGFSEGSVGPSPIVVFERDSTDAYRLVGYAWPAGNRMRTFALGKTARIRSGAEERIRVALTQTDPGLAIVALSRAR